MKLWFSPSEPDWPLLNPSLRQLDLDYQGPGQGEFHTGDLTSVTVYNNGSITRIIDSQQSGTQHYNFIGDSAGAWARNVFVPRGEKLQVFITARSADAMVIDFEFFLHESSELELRYLGNVHHRQTHARFRINHLGINSRSDVRTATIAHKGSASTVLVDTTMPPGCAGSASSVKCYNWSAGGRIGSLPIISVGEPDVAATHGNVVYDIDREAVFLLQLRGIDPAVARGEILYGQLIQGMSNDGVDLLDWDDLRECLNYEY